MNLLQQLLSGLISSGKSSSLKFDDDSLMEQLAADTVEPKKFKGRIPWQIPYQKGLRLILILAAIIVSLTFVLYYSVISLREGLLYQNSFTVTDNGAMRSVKCFGREYDTYLFNTSELWADTGIHVSKGDHVRLSFSGAFHSSAYDLYLDSRDNTAKPEVRWVGQRQREDYAPHRWRQFFKARPEIPQIEKNRYALYPGSDREPTYLGAILYSIAPEYLREDDPDAIMELGGQCTPRTGSVGFKARNDGVLRLAVNDIYFRGPDDLKEYASTYPTRFGEGFPADRLVAEADSASFNKIFYNDNIGQVQVCVAIRHPLKSTFGIALLNPRTYYRWLETAVSWIHTRANNVLFIPLSFVPLLGFMAGIVLISLVWYILVLGGIYLLFLLGYWISLPFRKHTKKEMVG